MISAAPSGSGAVAWDAARELAASVVRPLGDEQVPLSRAVDRITAREVHALQPIPHYASSAMDGWAVSGKPPWAVMPSAVELLGHGSAVAIATGGLIPPGADAVVRSEHASVAHGRLSPDSGRHAPIAGADIRPTGEEAAAGEVLIAVGTRLNPAHIAVAAACGYDSVTVTLTPRVALLLTGDEVDGSGVPAAGRVRDSFGPVIPSLIQLLGGSVVSAGRVADRLDATVASLESATGVELVVTTGGTGGSAGDHVREALVALGAEIIIPRLSIRPGGPTLLARLPDGRLVAGLPGNPLAAITGLLVTVAPALAVWTGRGLPPLVDVVTAQAIPGRAHSTLMIPFRHVVEGVVPSSWVGAGMMRGLADSSGLLVVPPTGLAAHGHGRAIPLPWAGQEGPAQVSPSTT
ncbi:MAG: molybdopterin molybdotransferase MoeA [Pseudolysinimonas sp.]